MSKKKSKKSWVLEGLGVFSNRTVLSARWTSYTPCVRADFLHPREIRCRLPWSQKASDTETLHCNSLKRSKGDRQRDTVWRNIEKHYSYEYSDSGGVGFVVFRAPLWMLPFFFCRHPPLCSVWGQITKKKTKNKQTNKHDREKKIKKWQYRARQFFSNGSWIAPLCMRQPPTVGVHQMFQSPSE